MIATKSWVDFGCRLASILELINAKNFENDLKEQKTASAKNLSCQCLEIRSVKLLMMNI